MCFQNFKVPMRMSTAIKVDEMSILKVCSRKALTLKSKKVIKKLLNGLGKMK